MVVGNDLAGYRKLLSVKPEATLDELRTAYNKLLEVMGQRLEKVTGFEAKSQIEKTISEVRIAYFFLLRAVMHPDYKEPKTESHWEMDKTHRVRRAIAQRIADLAKKPMPALPPGKSFRLLPRKN